MRKYAWLPLSVLALVTVAAIRVCATQKVTAENATAEKQAAESTKVSSALQESQSDIQAILNSSELQKYSDYTIGSIVQGEDGDEQGNEGQAYTVRLIKPFSTSNTGQCLTFMNDGNWRLMRTQECRE